MLNGEGKIINNKFSKNIYKILTINNTIVIIMTKRNKKNTITYKTHNLHGSHMHLFVYWRLDEL